MHCKNKHHIPIQSFGQFRRLVECSFSNYMVVGSRLIAVTYTSDLAPAWRKEIINIHTTKDCGFNLKFVRHMTKTYNQMHWKDKYLHLSSIIW